jgi:hypothetical protein
MGIKPSKANMPSHGSMINTMATVSIKPSRPAKLKGCLAAMRKPWLTHCQPSENLLDCSFMKQERLVCHFGHGDHVDSAKVLACERAGRVQSGSGRGV